MKHSTILVPVKCSERLPEEQGYYWTNLNELEYRQNSIHEGWYYAGQNHRYSKANPDFWYEPQHDKIVLSEEEYEQLKIQSLKLPKTHLKTPWSK